MRRRFLLRRLAMLLASLLVASFLIFAALYAASGNPVSALSGGRSLPPEAVRTLEHRYHLDEPFLVQYGYWLSNAVQGDLGVSFPLRENVSAVVSARIWTTIELVLYASILIVLVGVGLGVAAGLRPGRLDTSVLVTTSVGAAIPSFVAAILLTSLFAVKLGWFPAVGSGAGFADDLRHLTLPAISLAIAAIAIVARVTRAAIRQEAGREHVQTATSRGLPRRFVVRRHILRNAAIPITTVTGITIASLIAGSAVIETAFGLDGIGSYLVSAAASKDLAVVQGISLVLVAAFVLVNLLVDVLYAILDPRVSVGARAM